MKIPALSMASPLAHRLLREGATLVSDVDCEAVVHVDKAYLGHHGPESNFRPYLRLSGEMRSLRPQDRLPEDVDEVFARPVLGPTFDAFYEFTDEQLTQMVAKGYFTREFSVPEIMTGVAYELPVQANVLILEPADRQAGDVPLVFVDVHNKNDLSLDLESTGYDLEEYFTSVLTPQHEQERREREAASGEQARFFGPDYVDDIFNDPRFAHLRESESAHMAALEAEREKMEAAYEQSSADQRDQESSSEDLENEDLPEVEIQEIDVEDEPKDPGSTLLSLDELYEQVVEPYIENRAGAVPEAGEGSTHDDELDLAGARDFVESSSPQAEDEEGEIVFELDDDEEDMGPARVDLGNAPSPSPQGSISHHVSSYEDEAGTDSREQREAQEQESHDLGG